MNADIRWLDDPEIFRVNQTKAHSDHKFYKDTEDFKKGKSDFVKSLNGKWKFRFSKDIQKRPEDFYKKDFDSSGFDIIDVPSHIEFAGYDGMHYTNIMYPWEGKERKRTPYIGGETLIDGLFSKSKQNRAGSYITEFDLDEDFKGKRISLVFDGVEQAMFLWVNGEFAGYAEDSFTPSEFDITDLVEEKGNILAVEVFKFSTAAFLEDQDFFRFFGIFRDVKLVAKPKNHLEDMFLRTFEAQKLKASLKFQDVTENSYMVVSVTDEDEIIQSRKYDISENIEIDIDFGKKMQLWDYHNPKLYQFNVEIFDMDGNRLEIVSQDFGFRYIEIKDRVMLLNSKRLKILGVNRHEWSPYSGRCISEKEEIQDMQIIKRNNINSVRTSHYPNRTSWYDLCDKNGIYVMAETNLETHGTWQKTGKVIPIYNLPGDSKQWEASVVDRARSNFELLKNHTSIIFWSLGNESYAGECLRKMNEFFKENDKTRLVHYEGVFQNPEYKKYISDMESHMYSPPQNVRKYLESDPEKPFILCEYMHDMGNSLGGMDSYMNLMQEFEMYQGGYIWDFIDQAIYVKDEITGEMVLRYGGDFDDRCSDYEFSANGIVFADRSEKPAMQEVRYHYGRFVK